MTCQKEGVSDLSERTLYVWGIYELKTTGDDLLIISNALNPYLRSSHECMVVVEESSACIFIFSMK